MDWLGNCRCVRSSHLQSYTPVETKQKPAERDHGTSTDEITKRRRLEDRDLPNHNSWRRDLVRPQNQEQEFLVKAFNSIPHGVHVVPGSLAEGYSVSV